MSLHSFYGCKALRKNEIDISLSFDWARVFMESVYMKWDYSALQLNLSLE